MQSTLNTRQSQDTAPSFRPKVGRPPAALISPLTDTPLMLVEAAQPEAPPIPMEADTSSRWDSRTMMLSVALVLAVTLVLSRLVSPTEIGTKPLIDIAPAAEIVPMPISESATEATGIVAHQEGEPLAIPTRVTRAIDNEDRKRLLSILSKD